MKANPEHAVNSQAAPPQPAIAAVQRHQPMLTNDEFENLKRSIQLLRIEQIRYIVQKFNLPANGNKTKLIQIILSIIDTLRPLPLLVHISHEVNRLLAVQHEPFSNPLESSHKLEPYKVQGQIYTPPNPLIRILDHPPRLGPLMASTGTSTLGVHQIDIPEGTKVLLEFSWLTQQMSPFELMLSLNGNPFQISSDDPKPGSIDLTSFLGPTHTLAFAVDSIKTPVPMILTIRDYQLLTVEDLAQQIAAKRKISTPVNNISCKGSSCNHQQSVLLLRVIASYIATGKARCPICQQPIDINSLVFETASKN